MNSCRILANVSLYFENGKKYGHGTNRNGAIPKRPIAKTSPTKTAPKILMPKNVKNDPLRYPKRPIIQPKRPIAKSNTAHSYTSKPDHCHRHSATSKATLKFYMLRPVIHGLEALMILKQSNFRPCTMV